jgi:excisionase family DNA binding protein
MPIIIDDITVYSLSEIADLTGISLQTIRGYARKGVLKAVKVGTRLYVHEKDVKQIFETGTSKPTAWEDKKGKK